MHYLATVKYTVHGNGGARDCTMQHACGVYMLSPEKATEVICSDGCLSPDDVVIQSINHLSETTS